jgi:hypothetical protein
MSNDVTFGRRIRGSLPAKQRREDQAREDAIQETAIHERPSEAGRPVRAAHPWDATPDNPCASGRYRHDFGMRGRDGLRRCWFCAKLSPRSQAELDAQGKP